MKKIFIFPMVISFAMICACQKQDSAADAQLAQRKAELDAREKALDEREKAVSEWEKAMTKFRAIPSDLQSRKPAVDPEQAKAEREKRIQQLPPELRALIPNPAQVNSANLSKEREAALQGQTSDPEQAKAERDRRMQQLPPELRALIPNRSLLDARTAEKRRGTEDRAVELQRRLEEAHRKKMGAIASPNGEISDTQSSSPSPSPTPE
jgi:chromosome segregation ATPase